MTTKHTLICSLYQDKSIPFRTCTLSSKPSLDKLRDIYAHNFKAFSYVLSYCQKHHIRSLRVLSGLFPLSTHPSYETSCAPLVEEWLRQYGALDYRGVELSAHPDQFILLSIPTTDVVSLVYFNAPQRTRLFQQRPRVC